MPRDLSEVGGLARSPVFLGRVVAAMARVASQVGREPGTAEYHVLRREFAREFTRWTDDTAQGMAWLVAAQPHVTAMVTDGELVDLVNELWSAAAGAGLFNEWAKFDEATQ